MSRLRNLLASSIGAKAVVAVTGALLLLFVVAHMLGNLLVFAGQDALNTYAKTLKDMPLLLWAARIGLLAAAAVHVAVALRLARENRKARPDAYAVKRNVESSLASRTMVLSGSVVLAFVVYHLLHFTLGATHPEHFAMTDDKGRHDVYSMVVLGFRQPMVSGSYILAMGLLGMHIWHGFSSFFQTLGMANPRLLGILRRLGPATALAIVAGNVSIPAAVLLGWVGLPAS